MSRKVNLEFANFICKFGTNQSLLDYAEEIIFPAFRYDGNREYGYVNYFFHQVQLVVLKSTKIPTFCIAGRFVKKTQYRREQIFDKDNGIIKDSKTLDSAPTAIFVIILNNHKLLYAHETAYAPDINSFKSTAQKFIGDAHQKYINNILKTPSDVKLSKRQLLELTPYPSVEIIPLSTKSKLEKFVNQYKVLTTIEAKLVETNNELDLDGLFSNIRASMHDVGSKETKIIHKNKNGLSKENAIPQLNAAASNGNVILKLDGTDLCGDKLKGNNENFKVSVPMKSLSENLTDAVEEMYGSFENLLESGIIQIAEQSDINIVDKIKNLINKNVKQ